PTQDLRGSFVEATPITEVNTFDRFWETVNQLYVYRDKGSVSWDAIRTQYRSEGIVIVGTSGMQEMVEEIITFFPENTIAWQTREERIQRQVEAQASASYQGIGAYVTYRDTKQPHIVLIAVMNGSPAEAAGLQDHDSVYAVDGSPVTVEEGIGIIDRVRGPAGTDVILVVKSPGDILERDVVVKRGNIDTSQPQKFKFRYIPDTEILYIYIPRAGYPSMAEDFFLELQNNISGRTPKGIILDMRITSGSNANWPLVGFLAAFTDGEVGQFYSLQGTEGLAVEGQDFNGSQTLPLVVLVGPDTSGLPEIFAGSLQDNGRADIIGLSTSGAIEIYNGYAMPDGAELSIATASFVTTQGNDVGLNGVEPNFVVDSYWDSVSDANDPVIDFAVELIEGK
ncbi:MAG: S41 family peptidase, partial [Chloroflexota bacterium]